MVLLKDLEVTWRIILKYVLMNFDANMCKHRIYVLPSRDQLKRFVESNKTECSIQAGHSWPADGMFKFLNVSVNIEYMAFILYYL